MKKRGISFLLALVMVLSMLPVTTWAETDYDYFYIDLPIGLCVGESAEVEIRGLPEGATTNDIVWSYDEEVVSISGTTITALSVADTEYANIHAKVVVNGVLLDECYKRLRVYDISGYCGYNGEDGDGSNLEWNIDRDKGCLEISGQGQMADYICVWSYTDGEYHSAPWRGYYQTTGASCDVVVSEGVTSIGNYAFYWIFHSDASATIYLPDSITSIGRWAFDDTSIFASNILPRDLEIVADGALHGSFENDAVYIPAGVTTIGEYAFAKINSAFFCGNAPLTVGENAFGEEKAAVTIYYVEGTSGWTDSDAYDAASKTWHGYPLAVWEGMHIHSFSDWTVTESATCTAKGTETRTCACGEKETRKIAATGHSYANGTCTVCGAEDPDYIAPITGVTRIFGADRYETAFKTAEVLKQQLGVEKFDNIVVACGDNFADALGGSYLAAKKNAPILLVKSSKIDAVKSYIKANLNPGGTVYLLGGTAAIPAAMDTGLDGFTVRRLAGATRYDTNLLILEEAGVTNEDILICTGKSFADSLSAAAAGRPLLLVKDSLNDSQKAFLQSHAANKKYILGGTAAVSTSVENQAKAYGTVERIGGNTRYETSVLIAQEFFPDATQAALAYAQNFPDGLSGGALAYAMKAPLVLTASGKEAAAAAYAKEQNITSGVIFGGSGLISDKAVRTIFQMQSSDVIKIG